MSEIKVNFILNGRATTYVGEPRTTLLRALRAHGVTSVKEDAKKASVVRVLF